MPCAGPQVKMSLQLYQVDSKSYLLDFKSLNTKDHPDAKRVKRMTLESRRRSLDTAFGERVATGLELKRIALLLRKQTSKK